MVMRKCLLSIVMCMLLFAAKADISDPPFLRYSQTKPFNHYVMPSNRIMADTVYLKIFGSRGYVIERYTYYKHSNDGLEDIIIVPSDNKEITILYDLEGRAINYKSPINDIDEAYTYTNDGKLLSVTSDYRNSVCYYTNTGVDSLVSWQNHLYYGWIRDYKDVVTYNSRGYTITTYRYATEENRYIFEYECSYEFDEQDRIVLMDYENNNADDTSNDVRYVYYEDRVEEFTGNSTKRIYYFNDRNDYVKLLWYKWSVSGNWYLWEAYDWIYYYGESTVSNENIEIENELRISTDNGILYIENSDSSEPIIVSDISGRVIVNKRLSEGTNTIPVNKSGIYIIRKGSYSKKIVCP